MSQPGILIVDHGSRRAESNGQLDQLVELFKQHTDYTIVEPAHMELAEPTIATAFDRCVAQGAREVVVLPYFLAPGRHVQEDIPRLVGSAATRHADVSYRIAEPLGLHPALVQILLDRIEQTY